MCASGHFNWHKMSMPKVWLRNNSQAQAQANFNDMPIVVAIKIFVINYKYVEIARNN